MDIPDQDGDNEEDEDDDEKELELDCFKADFNGRESWTTTINWSVGSSFELSPGRAGKETLSFLVLSGGVELGTAWSPDGDMDHENGTQPSLAKRLHKRAPILEGVSSQLLCSPKKKKWRETKKSPLFFFFRSAVTNLLYLNALFFFRNRDTFGWFFGNPFIFFFLLHSLMNQYQQSTTVTTVTLVKGMSLIVDPFSGHPVIRWQQRTVQVADADIIVRDLVTRDNTNASAQMTPKESKMN
jgi:hypothetical protein